MFCRALMKPDGTCECMDCRKPMRFGETDRPCQSFQAEPEPLPPQPASLLTKAVNVTVAVVSHVAAGMPEVPEALYLKRLSICEKCPLRINGWECSECGCTLTTKAKWAEQSCPLDPPKWRSVYDKQERKGCTNCP